MCHEGIRVGQQPTGQDRRNQERMWGTRMEHEELGWDRRQHRRSQEGTGSDRIEHKMGHGMGYEELDMRTQDRDRRQRGRWGSRLGQGTPELDRSHWEGTYQGPGATPQPPLFVIPTGNIVPIPPPVGTHPGTSCDPPGKPGYFLEGGFGFTIPSLWEELLPSCGSVAESGTFPGKNCCICQEKSLWVEPGGLEPQRNGGVTSFPHQILGRSIVVPGEAKLMGFKDMKEKGLEKYSPLFF